MSSTDLPAAPAAKPKTSLITILMMLLLVVTLVMLGVVTRMLVSNRSHTTVAVQAATPPSAPNYLPLDPPFIVNFQEQDGLHLLQIGISLMSHDAATIEAAKNANTVIRNDLLLMLSNQDFQTLSGEQGKLDLQKHALDVVRKAVPAAAGHQGIEAVYFTSFVMQ
ncbi:flagellar basal body-associated FliL family protein [Frateuria aurantia]